MCVNHDAKDLWKGGRDSVEIARAVLSGGDAGAASKKKKKKKKHSRRNLNIYIYKYKNFSTPK